MPSFTSFFHAFQALVLVVFFMVYLCMDNLLTRVCIYIPEDCLYLSKNADPHVMPSYAVVYVPVYRFIKQQSLTLMSTSNVPPKYLFERLTLES